MSRVIPKKCKAGYRHYYEYEESTWDEEDEHGSRMRELVLVCARCHHVLYVDSITRIWMGLLPDDWGA